MIYPSRYAHLPTKEYDYKYILDNMEDEMLLKNVDSIIAKLKNKKEIKPHYRTNLKNLGLFKYQGDKIKLDNNVIMYKNKIFTLKQLLKFVIEENDDIMYIYDLVEKGGHENFKLENVAGLLNKEFPNRKYDDIVRWVRPIVFLLKYVYGDIELEIKKEKKNLSFQEKLKIVQNEYFKFAKELGEPIAIELIANNIREVYKELDMDSIWEMMYSDEELEYKVSFMTFPSWASENKPININNNLFTHIKIKKYIDGSEK